LEPPPPDGYDWSSRFDDPDLGSDRYQALSAADEPLTALCEVLQDFRPSASLLVDFEAWLGSRYPPGNDQEDALRRLGLKGRLPREWFEDRVLVRAAIVAPERALVDLDGDPLLLTHLEAAPPIPAMLLERGESHLTVHVVLSRDRTLSQRVGKLLYERDAAGVIHRSNVGGPGACVALFTTRARLDPLDPAEIEELTPEHNLVSEALLLLDLEVEW
jgi:RES domain